MAIGLIIIGDEILSGKHTDKHFPKMIELLGKRGLQLSWVECIGDDPERITATLKRALASGDTVFSCGGIGATPDDHTRECAAEALGVPLVLHPEAKKKIEERMADLAQEAGDVPGMDASDSMYRLKMGEFPQGAEIIPNSYNKIPGFFVKGSGEGKHYFLPGFPVMAWPMMEWVLDTFYPHLFHQVERVERSVFVYGAIEAALTPLMEAIEAEFPQVKVFSLPHVGDAHTRRYIDLGVKGEPPQVDEAFAKLKAGLDARKLEYASVNATEKAAMMQNLIEP